MAKLHHAQPRYPLDDSWLFTDPMTVAVERGMGEAMTDKGIAGAVRPAIAPAAHQHRLSAVSKSRLDGRCRPRAWLLQLATARARSCGGGAVVGGLALVSGLLLALCCVAPALQLHDLSTARVAAKTSCDAPLPERNLVNTW